MRFDCFPKRNGVVWWVVGCNCQCSFEVKVGARRAWSAQGGLIGCRGDDDENGEEGGGWAACSYARWRPQGPANLPKQDWRGVRGNRRVGGLLQRVGSRAPVFRRVN